MTPAGSYLLAHAIFRQLSEKLEQSVNPPSETEVSECWR